MNKKTSIVIVFVLAALIRLYGLGSIGPSLYWEEVALGYDAYSLLLTGHDHHNNSWPLIAFESFGDWKPSGYFYFLLSSVWLFGLSSLAVRLPSAVFGLLFVISVGFLAKSLWVYFFPDKKDRGFQVQLIASFIAAVEPWAVLLSRASWETNAAMSLTTLALALLWHGFVDHKVSGKWSKFVRFSILAALFTALGAYTYHANRVISPLFFIVTMLFQLLETKGAHEKRHFLLAQLPSATVLVACLMPLILALVGSNQLSARVAQTSIFSDISVIEQSNALRSAHNYSLLSRIVYHRYVLFLKLIVSNALTHFTPSFLFLRGDANVRHSVQQFGQLYIIDSLFLFIGILFILKRNKKLSFFLFAMTAIAVLPASITTGLPHALRTASLLPLLIILLAFGAQVISEYFKKWKWYFEPTFFAIFITAYSILFSTFWGHYRGSYTTLTEREWQYGYKEMIAVISEQRQRNPELPIYISREQGRPAMYYWFFTATDPRIVQQAELISKKDQSEFLEFENIHFVRGTYEVGDSNALISSSSEFREQLLADHPTLSVEIISEVRTSQSDVVWQIYEIK